MTSERPTGSEAFVWIWLPGDAEPIVAGRIVCQGTSYAFTYGRSYRERADAIPVSPFELPLRTGTFIPEGMMRIHSCLRDGVPDAWGRRVIQYRHPQRELDELDYMLLSGSDRVGALDFQHSASEYVARMSSSVSLEEISEALRSIDEGCPLPAELDAALLHGTSVGGARPKALVTSGGRGYVAKFSSSTDTYPIVQAEYIAMRLAAAAGLAVPDVRLEQIMGRTSLLVARFDREPNEVCGRRKHVLSGLSLLGLDEMEAGYASYLDLADLIRHRFDRPCDQLRELYRRLIFNVLVGNTDDHARNHAAFWDGTSLLLTPAYDICPQLRIGREATQAMDIGGREGRLSKLTNVLSVHAAFLMSEREARLQIEYLVETVSNRWHGFAEEADLPTTDRKRLWGRAVLNPFCLEGWSARSGPG